MAITFHDHENQFNIYDESDCLVDLRNLKHRIDEAIILDKIHTDKPIVVLRWDFLQPYRIRYISLALFIFCFLLSSLSYGQIAAAGWCVVTDQNQESVTDPVDEPPDDSFPPQPDEQPTQPNQLGCDIGIGFSLYTYRNRLAFVAVVGSESIGSGVAWILNPDAKSDSDHRPIMAIAIGIVTPYDGNGIGRNVQLALGMTLSLRQGVGDE